MITTEESGQRSALMRSARCTWLLSGATRYVRRRWSANGFDRVAVAVVDLTLPFRLESFDRFEEVQNLRRVLE